MRALKHKQRGVALHRLVLWVASGLFLILVLLVLLVAVLGRTQGGTQWIWGGVEPYLPSGVTVERVDGQLLGEFELKGIRVQGDGVDASLGHLRVAWRPRELLFGTLHLLRVDLHGLDYALLPRAVPEEASEPFELPVAIRLPFAVRLDEFVLRSAGLRMGLDGDPFVVDALRFGAALTDSEWQLDGLAGNGPLFELDGAATFEPAEQYTNALRISWTLRPPDIAELSGTTTLDGDLDRLNLAVAVGAPYGLTATAFFVDPLGRLSLEADVAVDMLQLQSVRDDLPALSLSAEAQGSGSLSDLAMSLQVSSSAPDIGTGQLELTGRYRGDAIVIDELTLTSPDSPGRLQGEGRVALGVDAMVDLHVAWQELQWPIAGVPDYVSPSGAATIAGTPSDYRLDSSLEWSTNVAARQSGQLTVEGRGDLNAFEMETLALSGAAGNVSGAGSVAWSPEFAASVNVKGTGVNPGAFVPEWTGDIDFWLAGAVQQRPDGIHGDIEQLRAEGSLLEQPLRIDGRARHDPQGTVIEQFVVMAGATRLSASGAIAENVDVSFSLDSDDLGSTLPGAAGSVRASGRAEGPSRRPRLALELDASDLEYGGSALDSATLNADFDASGAQPSSVDFQLVSARSSDLQIDTLTVTGSGTPNSHDLALVADSNYGRLDLAATGSLTDTLDHWAFQLQSALVQHPQFDTWRLRAPVAGVASARRQRLEQACFTSGTAQACAEGENTQTGAAGNFSVHDLPYAYLGSLLPETLELQGSLSTEGRLALPAGEAMNGSLVARTSAGTLRAVVDDDDAVTLLALAAGRIDAEIARGGVNVALDLPLVENGGLRGELAVAAGTAPVTARPLSGQLMIAIENLGVVSEAVGEVSDFKGRATGEMRLAGTLGAPEFDGALDLAAERLTLATPGLEIEDLVLGLTGRGETLDVRLSASSGGGSLSVAGEARRSEGSWGADLKVTGNEFQVVGTPEARLWASPDLTLGLSTGTVSIDGSLAVPRGEITPRGFPETGAITVSEDQVIVLEGNDEQAAAAGPEIFVNLRVIIGDPNLRLTQMADRGRNFDDVLRRMPGDKVQLDAFGLRSVLAGELLVTQRPRRPATAAGELRAVVGEYKAYGQDLTIRNGKLLFGGGPVTEPAVDINAYRQPQSDILVGVRVRGSLERPRLSVYSEPANMTQSEQLAWLVLGRPLSGASSSETSLVTQAALAFGLRGGNFVADNIRDKIGLDEFTLESQETSTGSEQAALVIGKYLTPELYISYGIGLFEPLSTVRMRYSLTERWHLETQSTGTESGGDIIYAIERGGPD